MGQWTPMDSLACSIGHLDRTNSSGIWEARAGLWIPMDCPTCPMGQWDRTQTVGFGGTLDAHRSSHLLHGRICNLLGQLLFAALHY